ncbi:hypothetical protein BC835DRAFT_309307 [Cytidiella melzeri]|nr:hypothetical protein BC835DRAFT_309307 [Cytidiella melzeri]
MYVTSSYKLSSEQRNKISAVKSRRPVKRKPPPPYIDILPPFSPITSVIFDNDSTETYGIQPDESDPPLEVARTAESPLATFASIERRRSSVSTEATAHNSVSFEETLVSTEQTAFEEATPARGRISTLDSVHLDWENAYRRLNGEGRLEALDDTLSALHEGVIDSHTEITVETCSATPTSEQSGSLVRRRAETARSHTPSAWTYAFYGFTESKSESETPRQKKRYGRNLSSLQRRGY